MALADSSGLQTGVILFFGGAWPDVSEHTRMTSAAETAVAAETAGFDDVWISEHHYLNRSNPAAIPFAAFVLGRTHRVRVGTAVSILPLHSPVHVAEQAALLDQLSGGRFDLGLGRGEATVDYEVMSSLDHLDHGMPQALDLLMDSFAGTVAANSDLYRFRRVAPRPRPLTEPHPPVLVASEGDATLDLAARHGLASMFFLNPAHAAIADRVQRHAAIAAEHGRPGPWQHTLLVYAQVADTDAEAAAIIRGPLRASLARRVGEWVWLRESWRQHSDVERQTENIIAHHVVGSPTTCIDRLVAIVEGTGATRVIFVVEAAGTPEGVLANVQRLGRDVLPAARARLGREGRRN